MQQQDATDVACWISIGRLYIIFLGACCKISILHWLDLVKGALTDTGIIIYKNNNVCVVHMF